MFRKTKAKTAVRPRTSGWDENEAADADNFARPSLPIARSSVGNSPSPLPSSLRDEDLTSDIKVKSAPVSKPTSLLSFENDEDADGEIEFKLKKSKKHVKEVKRMHKLEKKAKEMNIKQEVPEDDPQIKFTKIVPVVAEKSQSSPNENFHATISKAKDTRRFKSEEDFLGDKVRVDEEAEETTNKFPSTFSELPDSRAIYEARKRRERMRKEGTDGYIPLDDDQKLRDKGARHRLVREDDNDDSDEDHGKFYSSRTEFVNEEARRREEQSQFLEKEQGDDDRSDEEVNEWEQQQILKAVSRSTIGQINFDHQRTMEYYTRQRKEDDDRSRPIDMDLDMEIEDENSLGYTSSNRVMNVNPGASHVSMEEIMAKLKLRLNDREESLNALRQSKDKIDQTIQENKESIRQLESAGPVIANKFTMYQEMKLYTRSLLDCLNEKVGEINLIIDKRRHLDKAKSERLTRRRRRDVRDAYDECAAAAAGKNAALIRINDHGIRAAERDARRARRRRERESNLSGISHEDGLSSDDEETTSQNMAAQQTIDEVNSALDTVFVDALDEYCNLKKVLDRMVDWLSVDGKSFEDAYVHLCIPKLAAPYVKMQLARADILKNSSFRLDTMQWYTDVLLAGVNSEIEYEHHIVVGMIPAIVEKVVVPFLTDIVNEEWDPLSLKQTQNLSTLLKTMIEEYPTIVEKSKPIIRLVEAIQRRLKECTDEDLFVPMYSKQAIENPSTGCRAFLDRQFWTAIKLIRCINSMSCILSDYALAQMILESVAGRTCALALQMGNLQEQATVNKVRSLIREIDCKWIILVNENSTRSLASILYKVQDEYKDRNKDFYKEVRKFSDKLKNRNGA